MTERRGGYVAQKVGERLKQQVFVENRVGASGDLGSEAVARADADGYTMGLANASTHAVAPSVPSRLGYDPVKDFAPVSMLGSSPFVLSVYPGLPARSVAELLALAKAKPRTRTPKVTRMKVVWGVFNNSNQRVAVYEYPKRKEAD